MTDPIAIVSAKRTAIANFNGSFANVPAHELGAHVIKAILTETAIDPNEVSEVILGQVLTAGQGQNPARQAALAAGLSIDTPAWGVNQVCGSGLKAIMLAAQSIANGDAEIIIAGGQENMTMSPHVMHLRSGIKMGDGAMVDSMIKDGLWEAFNDYHMGMTAENIANEHSITREQQDQFAAHSQAKAAKAIESGAFDSQIVPVTVKSRKAEVIIDKDEFPRADTTTESLGKLRPAFDRQGTVTAGNASGLNDGAAAVMLMKKSLADEKGLSILATISSYANCGVEPKIMGTGPIPASKKALDKAKWNVEDLDLVEANEAFAVQAISVNQGMGWNTDIVNVNGGAIALGHPIGASGARILVTLLHEMQARDAKKGLATLCVGGGMGVACCVQRD